MTRGVAVDLAFWIADYATSTESDGYANSPVPIAFNAPRQDLDEFILRAVDVVLYGAKLSTHLFRCRLSSNPLDGLRQMIKQDGVLWSGYAYSDVVPSEDSSIRFALGQSLFRTKE